MKQNILKHFSIIEVYGGSVGGVFLYKTLILTLCIISVVWIFSGCVTTGLDITPPVGVNTNPDNAKSNTGYANRELQNAQRMIQAGNFSQVIPRLTNVISSYPETQAAIDARYYLGVTYNEIGGMRNAKDLFMEYLEYSPDGIYASNARQFLAILSDEAEGDPKNPVILSARATELEQILGNTPDDLSSRLELADIYWNQERYNEAGQLYSRIIRELPQMQADHTIRQRIERATDGTVIILTPNEVLRRQSVAEPILIFNSSSFKSGRFEGWPAVSQYRYYNVTGQAVNRSNETLSNVQVIITIFGFGNKIYETTTVNMGNMRPGETRPFSVQFTNFDDIQNVSRYESNVTYQK